MLKRTLKDVEKIFRDIAGFHMSYDGFTELCRGAWKDIIIIFILMDLKRKMRFTVFTMKTNQTCLKNVYQKIVFKDMSLIYQINNEEERAALERLAESQVDIKQLRQEEKIGGQDFRYDASDLFEPITKTVEDANQKILEESKASTRAFTDDVKRISYDYTSKPRGTYSYQKSWSKFFYFNRERSESKKQFRK